MSLKKELQVRLLDQLNLEEKKSKFSANTALFFGKKEIAHFHQGNELDLRLTKAEIKKGQWLAKSDPRLSQERKGSEWVQVRFRKEEDLSFILQLTAIAIKANA